MRLDLTFILFILFAIAQFFCSRKVTHKILRFLPTLLSVVGAIVTLGIIYIGNNAFGVLFFIPVGISFVGNIVGFIISLIIPKQK